MPSSPSPVHNPLYQAAAGLEPGEHAEVDEAFQQTLPSDCLLTDLGVTLLRVGRGESVAEMRVGRGHLNQRGVAQAGAIVALADAAAGWASYSAVEDGRFTTLALDTKLIRPASDGDILIATATTLHLGRRTHLVDVAVAKRGAEHKPVARFTCQQLVLGAGPT